MRRIVLASKSPRRKELLNQIGLKFTVDVSDIDESKFSHTNPTSLAKNLSKAKAEKVAQKYKDAVIIAADTLVVLGKEIIGKPKDPKDAKKMLQKLSGKTHTVITGFTIFDLKTKKKITKAAISKVRFAKMSEKEIEAYVRTGEPLDKAGGYGIQNKAAVFIKETEGDFFNIVGLPLYEIAQALKKINIAITLF